MATENKLYSFRSMLEDGIEVKDKETGSTSVRKIGKILIPMIQRPYAQGRKSQVGIRKSFLGDIFGALTDKSVQKYELNFVYGTFVKSNDGEESNTFELLDGQQRLTTLFLLHWYLATVRKNRDNNFTMPAYMSDFTYQTRTSSSDFIDKLVKRPIILNDKPSRCIRNSVWYSKSFDKDTTIDAMLRMLDSIEEFYNHYDIKPEFEDLDKLQFYVLELNGFGLSEELFIKMNARGLQLTPFENFKADLIGRMKKVERYQFTVKLPGSKINRMVPYWMSYSALMDTQWQDLFWTRPKDGDHENSGSKESDIRFFRFIQRYLSNKMITLDANLKNIRQDKLFRFFTDNVEIERHDSFSQYETVENYALSLPQKHDLIREFDKVLTFLSDKNIGTGILNGLCPSWETELTWKPWGTVGNSRNDVGQRNMILLSAMTEFIEKFDSVEAFDMKAYKQWMRVVHNIVANWDVSGEDQQINVTRLLKDWLEYTEDGLTVRTWESPYSTLLPFSGSRKRSNQYLSAEAKKAKQILVDKEWEETFIKAESNKFLTGSVTFYYEEGMERSLFEERTSKVDMLFDENGVVSEFRPGYFFIRAVLCRNYDWTDVRKGTTPFTLTNDNSQASRYLKVLTIWNENKAVKDLFCQLLDCATADEMRNVLSDVLRENHKLVLKETIWNDELAKANLQKAYDVLCKNDGNMRVLDWLYANKEKSMGLYVRPNGVSMLYKGPVNNVLLSTNRNSLITEVVEATKSTFDFIFIDQRQLESYNSFGVYSGDTISLKSAVGKLPNGFQLYLYFRNDGILRFNVLDSMKFAEAIYEKYKNMDSGETVKQGNQRAFFTWDQNYYYQALEIRDYESLNAKNLMDVLNGIYNLASDFTIGE